MANSRKLSLTDHPLSDRVAAQLAPLLPAHSAILIGLSGGLDSVVLLHLLKRLAPDYSWQLSALHVHHGISPDADAWADFCAELCAQYAIPLRIEHVDIAPLRARGIEAAARELRHAAFSRQACDYVALAQHADDQAETLLLQLLRGAGVRGASAMPVLSPSKRPLLIRRSSAPALLRPLLHSSRQEILDYAGARQLRWIEDESNADHSYPRNFLRHRVLPALAEKFPAYRDTLARSAQNFAEAGDLLDELAGQDAAAAMDAGTLAVAALQSLSPARAKNLLRYFLHRLGAPMPQLVQLHDMLQQLCGAREDAAVCVGYGDGWQVRRYRSRVYALRALGDFDRYFILGWQGEAMLDWPALQTRLGFQQKQGGGINLGRLQQAPVTLRLRHGGEALRPHPKAATRSLRNLLQERHIPPWRRERLPLLYCGDELVCVPGVAIAAEFQAHAQQSGLHLSELGYK